MHLTDSPYQQNCDGISIIMIDRLIIVVTINVISLFIYIKLSGYDEISGAL